MLVGCSSNNITSSNNVTSSDPSSKEEPSSSVSLTPYEEEFAKDYSSYYHQKENNYVYFDLDKKEQFSKVDEVLSSLKIVNGENQVYGDYDQEVTDALGTNYYYSINSDNLNDCFKYVSNDIILPTIVPQFDVKDSFYDNYTYDNQLIYINKVIDNVNYQNVSISCHPNINNYIDYYFEGVCYFNANSYNKMTINDDMTPLYQEIIPVIKYGESFKLDSLDVNVYYDFYYQIPNKNIEDSIYDFTYSYYLKFYIDYLDSVSVLSFTYFYADAIF